MLVNLYQQKLDLFKQLGKLSSSMAEFAPDQLIEDDVASEEFFSLLDERTALMDQIDELDAEIESFKGEVTGQEVGLLRRALQAEMVSVQSQNEIIEGVIKKSLGQLRTEAQKLQSGKQSNRAYIGRIRSTEGSFIDKRR